jgi:hypothetical protein
MITKTLFLAKEKYRIGVRNLRDHVPGQESRAEYVDMAIRVGGQVSGRDNSKKRSGVTAGVFWREEFGVRPGGAGVRVEA